MNILNTKQWLHFSKSKYPYNSFNIITDTKTAFYLTTMASRFSSTMEGPYGSTIGSTRTSSSGLTDWKQNFQEIIQGA